MLPEIATRLIPTTFATAPLAKVRSTRCERGIEPDAARRVIHVWDSMIKQARARSVYILDGESYEFAVNNNGSTIVASAESPREGSRGDMLVKIVTSLKRVCVNGFPFAFVFRRQLDLALTALEMRLDE